MPKVVDKVGMVFDQLTVVEYAGINIKNGRSLGSLFKCNCSCGNVVVRTTSSLRNSGKGINCGSCKITNRKAQVGQVFKTKHYGDFEVIEYIDSARVKVKFLLTGYKKITDAKSVDIGQIKDPYYPSVHGVGYLGEGAYPASYNRNGKKINSPAYEVWNSKLKNCYGSSKSRHLYKDVEFCDEWLCFQNFAKWFYEQVELYGKGGNVDKDLLFLGSREYSPHTCVYVPPAVNSLFTGASGNISGVHWCNTMKKWVAQIQRGELTAQGKKKQSYLGRFDNKEEANKVYYTAKLEHVKSVALKYQEQIPPALFYKLYHGTENYLNYYMFEKENNNDNT